MTDRRPAAQRLRVDPYTAIPAARPRRRRSSDSCRLDGDGSIASPSDREPRVVSRPPRPAPVGAQRLGSRRRHERTARVEAQDKVSADEAKRLVRRRVLFLAVVLLASTLGVELLSAVSPARTFAVASSSMEPLLSRGDLVVTRPGAPEVGDVVVYAAATGDFQAHRVVRVVPSDGSVLYVTRGDANDGDDSFLVRPGDVEGVVERDIPLLGYLWLVPMALKLLLFTALLASYVYVTLADARAASRTGVGAMAVLLILWLPTAMAGVSVDYASSSQANDAAVSPLPLSEGGRGTTTVASGLNSATAQGAPVLWKEVAMLGGGGAKSVTATSYTTYAGSITRLEMADYDPDPLVYLEAYAKAPAGQTVSLRLWDRSAAAVVAGSEISTSSTDLVLMRSAGFSLTGVAEYQYQAQTTGGTAEVRQVKLVLRQEGTQGATETQVRLASEQTTGANAYFRPDGALTWRYDASAMDGVDAVYFEAVGHQRGAVRTGTVRLWDATAGASVRVLEFPGSDGQATRVRGPDIKASLVDGREYHVEIACGLTCVDSTFDFFLARMVIEQSGFTETVSYVDVAGLGATSATSYTLLGNAGRHDAATAWDRDTAYFEATLRVSGGGSLNGNDAWVRLSDGAGTAVTGSERTVHAAQFAEVTQRLRSDGLRLRQDQTYRAELREADGVGTDLVGAWILLHQQIGETVDHVMRSSVATASDTCTWRYSLRLDGSSSLGRLDIGRIDWRTGATDTALAADMPGTRYDTSAVWTGSHAYVFGGNTGAGHSAQILRYEPVTDGWSTMAETLPFGRSETSAVWTGTHAYIFGGGTGSETAQIVRYDPATDEAVVMGATLPTARRLTSAVWDGTHAYIFGGVDSTGNLDDVVRYDPVSDTATLMAATLPTARYGTSAVWDGEYAYVFAGANGGFFDDILRYDPATGKMHDLPHSLPTARYYTSAVWDGTYAYIIGGYDTADTARIDRYDPVTGDVTRMDADLPKARRQTSAVWAGGPSYIFGGVETPSAALDDTVRFDGHTAVVHVGGIGLPSAREAAGTAWSGTHGFVFGGHDGTSALASILRHDPARQLVGTMTATLPTARQEVAAVAHGGSIYIIGGRDASYLDDIVRYDPATDTATLLAHQLPAARAAAAVASDGTYIYVIGGHDGSAAVDTILRYDPATGDVATLAALPSARSGASAVWTGSHVHVFGGAGASASDEIVRYDPAADTATVVANLPSARQDAAVVWAGTYATVYGGRDGATRLGDVVRFDPAALQVTTLAETLPSPRSGMGATWDGTSAYLFGGSDGSPLATVLRHEAGAVDDVDDLPREFGTTLDIRPGGHLDHVLSTTTTTTGSSTFTTTLLGRCIGHGIHTEQPVTYVLH